MPNDDPQPASRRLMELLAPLHKRKFDGEHATNIELRPEPIDDVREPGMSDAQLRDKILRQFQARGMQADVRVEGDHVQVRVEPNAP